MSTDRQCEVIEQSLGDDMAELIGLLTPWGRMIRDAGGYPPQGPHDLARRGESGRGGSGRRESGHRESGRRESG